MAERTTYLRRKSYIGLLSQWLLHSRIETTASTYHKLFSRIQHHQNIMYTLCSNLQIRNSRSEQVSGDRGGQGKHIWRILRILRFGHHFPRNVEGRLYIRLRSSESAMMTMIRDTILTGSGMLGGTRIGCSVSVFLKGMAAGIGCVGLGCERGNNL